MKILLAPDKFKGSLSAIEVCQAMAHGIAQYDQSIASVIFPMADGGEGTAAILTHHSGGSMVTCSTQDPLFRPIESSYGRSVDGKTAFIEMAEASGLHLLTEKERNPLLTSTYGTGLMILDAIKNGAQKIILGIGGSATNDGGIGLAAALGYVFLGSQGQELVPVGKSLSNLHRIDSSRRLLDPDKVTVEIACDVKNPLFGSQGAAFIYAPQKGADQQQVKQLDLGLRQLDKIIARDLGITMAELPGAGAAGGLGGGAIAFLNARLTPGIELVMQATAFEEAVESVDLIFTGEGKIDRQTKEGKVVAGVAQKAREKQIPVVAICGMLELGPTELSALGLQLACDLISLTNNPKEAVANAQALVQELSRQMVAKLVTG